MVDFLFLFLLMSCPLLRCLTIPRQILPSYVFASNVPEARRRNEITLIVAPRSLDESSHDAYRYVLLASSVTDQSLIAPPSPAGYPSPTPFRPTRWPLLLSLPAYPRAPHEYICRFPTYIIVASYSEHITYSSLESHSVCSMSLLICDYVI